MNGEELGTQGQMEENDTTAEAQGTENAQAQEGLLDGDRNGSPNGDDGDSSNDSGSKTNTMSEVRGTDDFKAHLAERDKKA